MLLSAANGTCPARPGARAARKGRGPARASRAATSADAGQRQPPVCLSATVQQPGSATLYGPRSAELLGHSDDDALRPAQEADPVDVLVLRDLVEELGTVAAQP